MEFVVCTRTYASLPEQGCAHVSSSHVIIILLLTEMSVQQTRTRADVMQARQTWKLPCYLLSLCCTRETT